MNTTLVRRGVTQALVALLFVSASGRADDPTRLPPVLHARNATGIGATFSSAGSIDLANPFFQSLGAKRPCVRQLPPAERRTGRSRPKTFASASKQPAAPIPIFRTNDGSNSPTPTSRRVEARRAAYSMLLDKGLIRVGIGIPADAEFELIAADDPYGYAQRRRTLAVPPTAAYDQSEVPEHGDVGWPRDVQATRHRPIAMPRHH